MKGILIFVLSMFFCQITLAESESYECNFPDNGNTNWVSLEIDLKKNLVIWGGDELYNIKHNNKDYVTAYGQMGYTDHVGGAVLLLDRKNMELHLSDLALLVTETDGAKKYIGSSHSVAKCRKNET